MYPNTTIFFSIITTLFAVGLAIVYARRKSLPRHDVSRFAVGGIVIVTLATTFMAWDEHRDSTLAQQKADEAQTVYIERAMRYDIELRKTTGKPNPFRQGMSVSEIMAVLQADGHFTAQDVEKVNSRLVDQDNRLHPKVPQS